MAIKLTCSQLPDLMRILEKDFPASFNVYFLARNTFLERYAWPELEFFVDSFPNINACICRTAPLSRTDIPPLFNGYSIFSYANEPKKLAELIAQEGVIDWTQTISFCMTRELEDVKVIKEKCLGMGGTAAVPPGENLYDHGVFVRIDLTKLPSEKYNLPEGLRLGSLAEEHAEQVTREKFYGDPEVNRRFFCYVFREGFPSSAIFDADNKLVAYLLQRPENVLGCGFVAAEHRSKGFFNIVCYDLARKMRDNGETMAYADVSPNNVSSLKAMYRLGGVLCPGQFEWFQYKPREA